MIKLLLIYLSQPCKHTVCILFYFLFQNLIPFENNVEPDQLASIEASWSGSTMFFNLMFDLILYFPLTIFQL